MDRWRAKFLGLKELPREITAFEIEAFFTLILQPGAGRSSSAVGRIETWAGTPDRLPAPEWMPSGCAPHHTTTSLATSRASIRCGHPRSRLAAGIVPAPANVIRTQAFACDVLRFRSMREHGLSTPK